MSELSNYFNKKLLLITTDGRCILGLLQGFDDKSNIILSSSFERVFSKDEGVEIVPLGLYLIKGDNLVCASELDTDIDDNQDWTNILAEPIHPLTY